MSKKTQSELSTPRIPYGKTWAIALLLTACVLSAAELHWRSLGHQPSVTDSKTLWAQQRAKCSTGESNVLAILGASRARAGIVPTVIQQMYPDIKIANLAVNATSALATLEDLANDEDFHGSVWCAMCVAWFFLDEKHSQQPWVSYYHDTYTTGAGIEDALNLNLNLILQSNFTIFSSDVNIQEQLLHGPKIKPSYRTTYANRHMETDFTVLPKDSLPVLAKDLREWMAQRYRGMDTITPLVFTDLLRTRVRPLVKKIQTRGGEVVFIRMPTTGMHWVIDQEQFPKEDYWNHIAPMTGAETIHFKDFPALAQFECPDESHLQAEDARQFTKVLAEI